VITPQGEELRNADCPTENPWRKVIPAVQIHNLFCLLPTNVSSLSSSPTWAGLIYCVRCKRRGMSCAIVLRACVIEEKPF
jgi:hypothetical protein